MHTLYYNEFILYIQLWNNDEKNSLFMNMYVFNI